MSQRSNPYRAAGTFSGPSYTERKADTDLLRAIQQNQRYPYVLAPRQSGKSSLITHVRTKLSPPEFRTAFIDLSIFTSNELTDSDEFQRRFFSDWHRSLCLSEPFKAHERFLDGIELLLQLCPEARVVTFIDEIDALLKAEFKDTFFSILRNIFNGRASRPELERMQFVLSGAARSEQLIGDPLRSPFNVGENIMVEEFSLQETEKTCRHLAEVTKMTSETIAEIVYRYASGSVYLTQLMLEKMWSRAITRERSENCDIKLDQEIKEIVSDIVAGAGQNIHFKNIRASFQSSADTVKIARKLFEDRGKASPSERELLWFTGLSPRDGGRLYRNRVYQLVFQAGGPLDLEVARTPIPHNLPFLQTFFGREEELLKISDALDPENRTWGTLIEGPSGIGKTSLAVRAAYDAPTDVFDKIVFTSPKSRELDDDGVRDLSGFLISGLAEVLNELARELGHIDIAKAPYQQRPQRLLEALRGTRTLLVLDNLESLLKPERDVVFAFVQKLPPGCKAILTSRGRIGVGSAELILEKLSEPAALATLAKLAESNTALAKTTEVERRLLYQQTGGNPLLLRWTAGQIGRGNCLTFTDAIAYLRSCPDGNDPLEFMFGDLVEDLIEAETLVLSALTYFTPPIDVGHIADLTGSTKSATDRALRRLTSRSLVVASDDLRTFALVPLVADFLRRKRPMAIAETGTRLEKRAYALIVENGYQKYDRFPVLEAAWPVIAAALPRFLVASNDRLQIVSDALSFFLEFSGRWDELLALARDGETRAVAVRDFTAAGWRAYQAGWVQYLRGISGAALACADRAEAHWCRVSVDVRQRSAAVRLRGLGHQLEKNYSAAIASYREALSLSIENKDIAMVLNDLANAESLSGDLSVAEHDYREALRIAQTINFSEGVATYTGNLASLLLHRAEWRSAEDLAREALALSEEVGRLELIAENSQWLAMALVRQGKTAEAFRHAQRAVDIYTELGAPHLSDARKVLTEVSLEPT